jgi:hypothetical protein
MQEQEDERRSTQLKKIIKDEASKGVFDHIPLLSATHSVTCPKCKRRQQLVYLDYLKSGDFELGKAEQIEVLTPQGPVGIIEMEKFTPIAIKLGCVECHGQIEVRPISAEYLIFLIDKPTTSRLNYIE